MPAAMVLLDSVNLSATASTIEFNGTTGYRDLMIVFHGRVTTDRREFRMILNSDSSAIYNNTFLYSWPTANAGSASQNSITQIGQGWEVFRTTNFTPMGVINIMEANQTNKEKIVLWSFDVPNNLVGRNVSRWRSQNAVTSVRLFPSAGVFDVGTRADIYGVTA